MAASTAGYQPSVEDKLHTMAANFRRERDEAHRRQMTAKERLRLAEQEAAAMTATVAVMEKDYKALQQQMGNEQDMQNLAKDVEMLIKEVRCGSVESTLCAIVGSISRLTARCEIPLFQSHR